MKAAFYDPRTCDVWPMTAARLNLPPTSEASPPGTGVHTSNPPGGGGSWHGFLPLPDWPTFVIRFYIGNL